MEAYQISSPNHMKTSPIKLKSSYKAKAQHCFGTGHNLSLICQLTSEDIKHQLINAQHIIVIVQELCESRGGRPGLPVLTSLLVSMDIKNY